MVAGLEKLTIIYPPPNVIRSDNGPEFIAQTFRGWCEATNTSTAYIEPGSPWENCFAESYVLRSTAFTRACSGMSSSIRNCLPRLQRLNSWLIAGAGSTNTFGPHSALQVRTPLDAAQQGAPA